MLRCEMMPFWIYWVMKQRSRADRIHRGPMILIRNLSLTFHAQRIFDHIDLTISKKQRIGLFGLNGAGKSTLLRAIAGIENSYEGSITIERGFKVGYMPQEVILESDKSIFDETMTVFSDLVTAKDELHKIEEKLKKQPDNIENISRYAELCDQIAHQEPEKKRVECEKILQGLGFSKSRFPEPVSTLSTGWKMRIVLAKLLLQNADFYLFDEPTNHLDMVAKEWFLHFLKIQHFGFLLVCHEKYLLNQVCNQILELERGSATLFNGNYDVYVGQKETRREQLLAAYEAQQREIKDLEATINRFRAGTRATQAQSMIKRLGKIERIQIPPSPKHVSFHFPVTKQSSRILLTVKDLSFSYATKMIFQHCSFSVERGNRIAIVAPNGTGKTTLIEIIQKTLQPSSGSLQWGEHISTAVFNQDQRRSLDQQLTVFENAQKGASAAREKIRGLLGAFLFDADAINKPVSVLSGGEQNRLGMVRVLLKNANFLLLDEPTNHLDIPSKEVLVNALKAYEGTIVFVSHDHDFIRELATHILELNQNEAHLYGCDYETYLYQKRSDQRTKEPVKVPQSRLQSVTTDKSNHEEKQQKKELRDVENKLSIVEKKIKQIEDSFLSLTYGTPEFHQADQQLKQERKKLEDLSAMWEKFIK